MNYSLQMLDLSLINQALIAIVSEKSFPLVWVIGHIEWKSLSDDHAYQRFDTVIK